MIEYSESADAIHIYILIGGACVKFIGPVECKRFRRVPLINVMRMEVFTLPHVFLEESSRIPTYSWWNPGGFLPFLPGMVGFRQEFFITYFPRILAFLALPSPGGFQEDSRRIPGGLRNSYQEFRNSVGLSPPGIHLESSWNLGGLVLFISYQKLNVITMV